MEPAIKKGDGGRNPLCFALRTIVKSVLVMRSFGPFGAVCWGGETQTPASRNTHVPLVYTVSM